MLREPTRWLVLLGLIGSAAALGCSAAVSSGHPPLVSGCQSTADCASAGPAFQCVDAGCMILACNCNSDCPAGLLCDSEKSTNGECVAIDGGGNVCN